MQEWLSDPDLVTQIGFITSALVALIVGLRKGLQSLSADKVISNRNVTEVNLIKSLSDDIGRLREEAKEDRERNQEEIFKLNENYQSERLELIGKIQELEAKVGNLTTRHEFIKKEALDIYIELSALQGVDIDTVKDRLLSIINSDLSL